MYRWLSNLFKVFLTAFLLIGMLIVSTQLLGLIIQSGRFIVLVNDLLSQAAYISSAIAAVLGFVLHYLKSPSET